MYLDPGFGGMIIQAVIASIAAAAAFIGIFRHKIKAFFNKNKQESVEEDIVEESDSESDD